MYIILLFCFLFSCFNSTEAFDLLDPQANITINWDVMQWTYDGYVATVRILNFQQYRQIRAPGWSLGWSWAKKELIWNMVGGEATEQGDCSKFKGQTLPHCCKKDPTVVDLLPGTPYNQRISNCCKGGVIAAWAQDPVNAAAAFQLSVGSAGTTTKTVRLPKNFTLTAPPGPGYTCGPAKLVKPSMFPSPDKRRVTQALMTWSVTCMYSQFRARRQPSCCVSLSSFYNPDITPCSTCACGCEDKDKCIKHNSGFRRTKDSSPLLQCTLHMCPVRVHWHVKTNFKGYWRVKISITNFNFRLNYTQWTLVVQHPNLNKVTRVDSFEYKPLPYGSINDTWMFYGMKFYNELLMEAGEYGNVRSNVLFQKDVNFMLEDGWAFPRRIYFNGDECQMPPPDSYPLLPKTAPMNRPIAKIILLSVVLFALVIMLCRTLYRRYKKRILRVH